MRCNLTQYGIVKISGLDAAKLLQGQLTCDVEKLIEPSGYHAAHCNPQGRIISFFQIFFHDNCYFLSMLREMIPIATSALKKYAVFYKVVIDDVTDEFNVIGHVENDKRLTLIEPISSPPFCHPEHPFCHPERSEGSLTNDEILRFAQDDKKDAQHDKKDAQGDNDEANSQQWHLSNINDGIPTIYPSTSGKFLPHEISLPELGAINFEKGCFTGQEIIARMHYRGKLKTHMYLTQFVSNACVTPGTELVSENKQQTTGIIVDLVKENKTTYKALIVTNEANVNKNNLYLDLDPPIKSGDDVLAGKIADEELYHTSFEILARK